MRIEFLILLFFVLISEINYVCSKEYFAVISNRLIRPNNPYKVAIKYQGYESEKILQIGLKNANFSDYKNITLTGDGDKTIEFLVSIQMQKFIDSIQTQLSCEERMM